MVMRALVVLGVCGMVICASGRSVAPTLAAQGVLPDAPGRDTTVKVCGSCHAPEVVASVRLGADGWHDVISRMVAVGAQGTDQELETVFQYLSTQFAEQGAKPLNLNKA